MAKSKTIWPVQKITAVALAGAITTLIAWGLDEFAGKKITPAAEGALITIITVLAGYLTPPGAGEVVEDELSSDSV
jgi:hypothetical protein